MTSINPFSYIVKPSTVDFMLKTCTSVSFMTQQTFLFFINMAFVLLKHVIANIGLMHKINEFNNSTNSISLIL